MDCGNEIWFAGRIAKKLCDDLLLVPAITQGSFMVRESETTPGTYTIAARVGPGVRNFRVLKERGMYFVAPNLEFPTLGLLVNHYMGNGIVSQGTTVQLTPFNAAPHRVGGSGGSSSGGASRPPIPEPGRRVSVGRPPAPLPTNSRAPAPLPSNTGSQPLLPGQIIQEQMRVEMEQQDKLTRLRGGSKKRHGSSGSAGSPVSARPPVAIPGNEQQQGVPGGAPLGVRKPPLPEPTDSRKPPMPAPDSVRKPPLPEPDMRKPPMPAPGGIAKPPLPAPGSANPAPLPPRSGSVSQGNPAPLPPRGAATQNPAPLPPRSGSVSQNPAPLPPRSGSVSQGNPAPLPPRSAGKAPPPLPADVDEGVRVLSMEDTAPYLYNHLLPDSPVAADNPAMYGPQGGAPPKNPLPLPPR